MLLFDVAPDAGQPAGVSALRSPPSEPNRGRWQMLAQIREGALSALLERTRLRNLGISGGILILLFLTVVLLFQVSHRAYTLAELQMNFVAGVSHEFRTPLPVIRTAAFNLRGKVSGN